MRWGRAQRRYAVLLERALAAYRDQAGWSYDPGHPRFAITYHAPITRIGTVQVQLWLDHLGDTSAV
jgi:acyl-CoA thioesterase FadM